MSKFKALLTSVAILAVSTLLHAAELSVFAAASLKDALTEIATGYEKESGNKVILSFGASNILTRQIEEGAPADVIFSADEAKLDALEKKGLILAGTRQSLLSNTLVIVVPSDATAVPKTVSDLTKPEIKKLALAEPFSVPVGIYAQEHLERLNLWSAVKEKVIATENVRASLAAVESGNVEAGIVYKTDALISKKVKVAVEIPASEGPKISYPLAVVKDSKQPDAAKKLTAYFASPAARSVFEKFGFIVVK